MRSLFHAGFCRVALLLLGATLFISCKETIEKVDALGTIDSISTQTVRDVSAIETRYGKVTGRLEAPLMETYALLADPFEIFPQGIRIEGYTPEGQLESVITANMAIHKTKSNQERWEAYGNVVIINHIKNETLKTDTLYWDRAKARIYTHTFVKLLSPQGLLQGVGMESDDRATEVTILRPFNSYGIMVRDTL